MDAPTHFGRRVATQQYVGTSGDALYAHEQPINTDPNLASPVSDLYGRGQGEGSRHKPSRAVRGALARYSASPSTSEGVRSMDTSCGESRVGWSEEQCPLNSFHPVPADKPGSVESTGGHELTEDALWVMRHSERPTRHRIISLTPKLIGYRTTLLEWMVANMAETLALNAPTIHSAVRYLDIVLDSVHVGRRKLQLVSLVCIFISAKYHEREEKVPSTHVLCSLADGAYTPRQVVDMEICVLSALGWRLSVLSPVHFLEYYVLFALDTSRDRMDGAPIMPTDVARTQRSLETLCSVLADTSLLIYDCTQFRPSTVAAACLVATRRALHITPEWPEAMAVRFGHAEEQLADCVAILWEHFSGKYLQKPAKDQAGFTPPTLTEVDTVF